MAKAASYFILLACTKRATFQFWHVSTYNLRTASKDAEEDSDLRGFKLLDSSNLSPRLVWIKKVLYSESLKIGFCL
jgi:hypothetical protein